MKLKCCVDVYKELKAQVEEDRFQYFMSIKDHIDTMDASSDSGGSQLFKIMEILPRYQKVKFAFEILDLIHLPNYGLMTNGSSFTYYMSFNALKNSAVSSTLSGVQQRLFLQQLASPDDYLEPNKRKPLQEYKKYLLFIALSRQEISIAKKLIARGAYYSVNDGSIVITPSTPVPSLKIMIDTYRYRFEILNIDIKSMDTEAIQKSFQKYSAEQLAMLDDDGDSLLHIIVKERNDDLAFELACYQPSLLLLADKKGERPKDLMSDALKERLRAKGVFVTLAVEKQAEDFKELVTNKTPLGQTTSATISSRTFTFYKSIVDLRAPKLSHLEDATPSNGMTN